MFARACVCARMYLCVCVLVCVRALWIFACLLASVYACVYAGVYRVCVYAMRARVCICVCVSVRVCVRGGESQTSHNPTPPAQQHRKVHTYRLTRNHAHRLKRIHIPPFDLTQCALWLGYEKTDRGWLKLFTILLFIRIVKLSFFSPTVCCEP